ncbi:hypothetical protein SOCE26_075820 [Sorangium cellulosum]|uniref:Uncharacterized protein n=1 Tax=Sorangium cellulosum TaxID=56 RepID=A0A2L0F3G8_SORCE|nr:DUF6573 family protein [Sorangium cellulosum]AUX46077.1 hypothetical protein SOCE26_075820 [Sorangium cellulosum]
MDGHDSNGAGKPTTVDDEITMELVYSYARRQAIEDGVLIDVSATARELGVKIPVAVTSAVWERYVKLTAAAIRAGNGEDGRLWDILWMFRWAANRARDQSEVLFELHVVTDSITPSRVQLKAICGPGDDCEPVITIMLPEED